MRTLRRDDIFVLAITVVLTLPVLFGGAWLWWFACARYGAQEIGYLLAGVWIYLGSRVLLKFVTEYLEPDPPSVAAFRELRHRKPEVARFLDERERSIE